MMFRKFYACLNCGMVFGGEKRSKKKKATSNIKQPLVVKLQPGASVFLNVRQFSG